MKMKVLNFGSLNIDYVYKLHHIVEKGETISSETLNTYPGGKGLNQSVALGKAGVSVFHAGAIGEEGRFLIEFLEEAGVDTRYIRIIPGVKTGHAVIQNDEKGDNCIILYGGANQMITKEQVDHTLEGFEAGDYLLLQNEINELGYIVKKARERGMIIVLNPSPMNKIIKELPLQYVDYFILNEIEAGQILEERPEDADKLIKGLRSRFSQTKIVLTLGSAGSWYCDSTKQTVQEIYPAETVDTTAAGDTYTGYFIAGILEGAAVEGAMDMAARASAIAVSRPGAGVSIPTRAELGV